MSIISSKAKKEKKNHKWYINSDLSQIHAKIYNMELWNNSYYLKAVNYYCKAFYLSLIIAKHLISPFIIVKYVMFGLVFSFKSFNFFECINTFNHKPFSIALSASCSENDVDDKFDKSFLKPRMLLKNQTWPKKYIVCTKNAKENKKSSNAKLIKRKTCQTKKATEKKLIKN